MLESLGQAIEPYGVDILQLGFATPPRPPESVQQAIESKIAATQLAEGAENEKRQAIAEAAKSRRNCASPGAGEDLLTRSLSPQLIEWKQLADFGAEVERQFPEVIGSNSVPLVEMPAR